NRLYQSEVSLRYRYVSADKPRPTSQTATPFPSTSTTTTTTTIEPPLPPDVYIPGQGGHRCVDHPDCPLHVANGLCTSNYYTLEQKKNYCPKACNLCITSTNVTTPNPSPVNIDAPDQTSSKCVDHPDCPIHIANGFCTRPEIAHQQRMQYCPKGCGHCRD
ncbi:shTK domain protein, partial [Ostertagia ostertagi]